MEAVVAGPHWSKNGWGDRIEISTEQKEKSTSPLWKPKMKLHLQIVLLPYEYFYVRRFSGILLSTSINI
jgi:hypothetical protein